MQPAVEFRGISKHFGAVKANTDVSFTIAKGSIHGLVGENGAGKSTLMSILYGYYRADGGDILLDGKRAASTTARKRSPSASAWCTSTSCWSRT
jgi:simple sugar transport system ATP-binding protein